MKKLIYLAFIFVTALLLSHCGTSEARVAADDAARYNPFVEAFTAGEISRDTPVYLILNQQLEADKMTSDNLRKAMKIKPDVKGEFAAENDHTIVFKPESEFERNKTYTITADISKFFDTEDKDKTFEYKFSTLPLSVKANFISLDVNADDKTSYDVTINVYTPDREDASVVESLIKVSEKGTLSWEHDPNGKKHLLKISKIPAGNKGVKVMTLHVPSNKYGVAKGDLLSVYIPAKNEFGVYGVEYITDPEQYIEVTFSHNLNAAQNLEGLARISNNSNTTVYKEGNKVRLYPDAGRSGSVEVMLSGSIKSATGLVLQQDIVRKVDVSSSVPALDFVGQGNIIPASGQMSIPFKAIYLKGVTVRVIKILENNIGQFLQENNLDGGYELMRVGRLIAHKTVFFDEDVSDFSKWGRYAIDMREIIEPEPGAIYRLELSYNMDLSAYPCDGNLSEKTKEQIAAEDEVKFRQALNRFDEGGYYYYSDYDDDLNWWNYNYEERDNPCSSSFYYYNTKVSKNILASDLGIVAKSSGNDQMVLIVHDLVTTEPGKGVEVTVYNYQHQVLGKGSTDEKGVARVSLAPGVPFYVIASQGSQKGYLKVDKGNPLSLSTFDVSGEEVQKGIKGFIYGDRGVWRPGDTLYLSFILQDKDNTLPEDHPVVMELYNPLGQLYLRKTQTKGAMGLYAFQMPTDHDAPTGSWEVRVNVGGVSFHKRVRVETIKPNRLKIDLKFDDKIILRDRVMKGDLHVEWLQGATARNLKYEIEAGFSKSRTVFPKYEDFVFDDPTKEFKPEEEEFTSGVTDESGNARLSGYFSAGESAPGMLTLTLNTRVYEESGDFSIDGMRMPYSPYNRYVGIKSPQKTKEYIHTGKDHKFEVVSVDMRGRPISDVNLSVKIYKVRWYWWWNSNNESLANYVSSSYNKPVKNMSVTTDSKGTGSIDLNFPDEDWGTYYISVEDKGSKHSTGVMCYFDWPGYGGSRNIDGVEAASLLSFKTDKDTYAPGDKMTVTLPSTYGSRAVVTIENGSKVIWTNEYECAGGDTQIKIDVTEDMMPNAYVYITLLQPYGVTANDLPIRMYGVRPFTVTSPKSHLAPEIKVPDQIRPESKYEITVSEKDGREMAYTLAIVDEGLLDLTRFATPDPWKAFNAREALGVKTWDMYNYVLGAYGGRIEQLFSIGGDDALDKGPKAIVNRFKPVVQFEGPFILKKGQKLKHSYTMPNYNGRVRVMVIAGDGKAYGNAEKSVMVKKPVMLLGTLPRVIGANEEMVVPATVFASEQNVGKVKVSISCSDNMKVEGPAEQELDFSEITDKQTFFRIKVGAETGAGKVTITAVSKNDKSVYETDIEIRSVRRPQIKVLGDVVEPGKTWKKPIALHGADGTNKLALEISNIRPLNIASRVKYLLGYPHGCLEQISSKGFPQLYLSQFADLSQKDKELAENAVKEVIRRMKSYQMAEGSFSYWPGGTSTQSWATVYATHFLLEAEAKGFAVSAQMKNGVLNNMKLVARNWKPVTNYYSYSEELTQAYRLYVLALAKMPELGAMNRLKEQKDLKSLSKWTLGAAYATAGRNDVAKELVRSTQEMKDIEYGQYDYTFGSKARDEAFKLITLTILDEGAEAAKIADKISELLSSNNWMSTQETSFSFVAISQYVNKYKVAEKMEFAYSYGDKSDKVNTDKNVWSQTLLENASGQVPMEVKNNGKSTLFLRVITEGTPDEGNEEAYANNIGLDVRYQDVNGGSIDITELEQGTNFTAVVTISNPTSEIMKNIVLTQMFPSGWEILNTRFMEEGAVDRNPAGVDYQDIRDDRVYSHIDRFPAGRRITVKINLAAVYEGAYYCPPVYCEAMYDNEIRANTEGVQVKVIR